MLYIGAIIENSAFRTWITAPGGGGARGLGTGRQPRPSRRPALEHALHATKGPAEAAYPEAILNR